MSEFLVTPVRSHANCCTMRAVILQCGVLRNFVGLHGNQTPRAVVPLATLNPLVFISANFFFSTNLVNHPLPALVNLQQSLCRRIRNLPIQTLLIIDYGDTHTDHPGIEARNSSFHLPHLHPCL